MALRNATDVPSQAYGAVALGGALGIITAWGVGFWVEVPAEVAAAFGSVWVFIAGRFIAD